HDHLPHGPRTSRGDSGESIFPEACVWDRFAEHAQAFSAGSRIHRDLQEELAERYVGTWSLFLNVFKFDIDNLDAWPQTAFERVQKRRSECSSNGPTRFTWPSA